MQRVEHSAVIRQPPEMVFAAAADPRTQLAWDLRGLQSVEPLTAGPLACGSKYRGVFKGFGKAEYEFTEYEPARRFTHSSRIPVGEMRHAFTFERVDGGTRMTQVAEITPNVVGWILKPVMSRVVGARFRTISDEIAGYLDG